MEKFKNIFWKKLKFCIQIPMTTSFKSDTAVIELKIFYILTVTLLYYFYCHYYLSITILLSLLPLLLISLLLLPILLLLLLSLLSIFHY